VVAPADAIIEVGDEVRCVGSWAVSTQSVEMSKGRVTLERRAEFAEQLEVVS
jgi:hypothetical protein